MESAIYASFSLDILSLSNSGLNIVPTVKAEILDSTNIKIPVKEAKIWTFFLLFFIFELSVLNLFFTLLMKPAIPPET